MQSITAYVIVSIVHNIVSCVGFGFVAFLMYHDRSWGALLLAVALFAILCSVSYKHRSKCVCPSCGHEFVAPGANGDAE